MIILGIDPGSRITGYGVIKVDNGQQTYLASGCIKTQQKALAPRLLDIARALEQLISQFQPDECAIEQVFVSRNVQSALKLGHARGVAMLALIKQCAEVAEYSPREIKQAVVGYGGADKIQVQQMIMALLGLQQCPQVDAADALAVALCHAQMRQIHKLKES